MQDGIGFLRVVVVRDVMCVGVREFWGGMDCGVWILLFVGILILYECVGILVPRCTICTSLVMYCTDLMLIAAIAAALTTSTESTAKKVKAQDCSSTVSVTVKLSNRT